MLGKNGRGEGEEGTQTEAKTMEEPLVFTLCLLQSKYSPCILHSLSHFILSVIFGKIDKKTEAHLSQVSK